MSEWAVSLPVALAAGGAVLLLDAWSKPRSAGLRLRSLAGSLVMILASLAAFGLALLVTGALVTSVALVVGFAGLVALVSKIKTKVLGEPLVFSDFALIGAVFQHPQFYLSALRGWQIALIMSGFTVAAAMVLWFSSGAVAPRLVGLGLVGVAGVLLVLLLRSRRWDELAANPDSHRDVAAHGLIAALLVHWLRWRKLVDPKPCNAPPIAGQPDQLVIVVQCESFADPLDLWSDPALELPGLSAARAMARQSGRLMVHGFGAYTMRTEYGVLFGRGEDDLGLRKFDPYLTAGGEISFSLPNRLSADAWTSLFVHPHDMRFYGRDKLMVEAGFTRLVGQDCFALPSAGEGRYVTDAAVADKIAKLAATANSPKLIYAVTIENHGPWAAGSKGGAAAGREQYMRLLQRSDALLARLTDLARQLQRPVILCFFGDHRPSIPGVCEPGADRHTPYVLLDIGPDGAPRGSGENAGRDLTPAQLHHLILETISSGSREG
jgi:hypothetical protein